MKKKAKLLPVPQLHCLLSCPGGDRLGVRDPVHRGERLPVLPPWDPPQPAATHGDQGEDQHAVPGPGGGQVHQRRPRRDGCHLSSR